MCDRFAFGLYVVDRRRTRAVSAAPTEHEQIPACGAIQFLWRNLVRHASDFVCPQVHHVLMVGWVVAHVAGDILLFEAADTVLQAGGPGNRPGAREPFVATI